MSPFPLFVEVIAVAETFFYLLVHLPLRTHLQREAVHPPAPSREEREVLFERCRRTIEDPERYVRKWFLGSKLEDVKRDNLKELYLWAFFNRGGPPGDDDEELEGYVDATEGLLGRRLAPGRGKAKSLRLTLDEVVMLHRSLIWYFVCTLAFHRISGSNLWSTVRRICRLPNIHKAALSWLSLPSHQLVTLLHALSFPISDITDTLSISCQASNLLVETPYFHDRAPYGLYTWHRYVLQIS